MLGHIWIPSVPLSPFASRPKLVHVRGCTTCLSSPSHPQLSKREGQDSFLFLFLSLVCLLGRDCRLQATHSTGFIAKAVGRTHLPSVKERKTLEFLGDRSESLPLKRNIKEGGRIPVSATRELLRG